MTEMFLIDRRPDGVTWLTLNRPEIHNAFDDRLIAALTDQLLLLGADESMRALARLTRVLNELPQPTIARVNGAALGGGVGLVVCSDIAIASEAAVFGLTEVRLGIMPSVIGPHVLSAIGQRWTRRLMLTGERIG